MSCCPYAACTYAAPLTSGGPNARRENKGPISAKKAALLDNTARRRSGMWYALRPEEA